MPKPRKDRRVTLLPLVHQKLEARAAAENCSVSDLANAILTQQLTLALSPRDAPKLPPAAPSAAPTDKIYTQNLETW
ncbi:MAG: hypothetical protein AAF282_05550 [Cyanobacteria bacterium P01_A01_bin.15]